MTRLENPTPVLAFDYWYLPILGQGYINAYDCVRLRSTAVRLTRSVLSLVGSRLVAYGDQ